MGASCGDVFGFSRERARRREVVPLAIGCAARIYPYTIYAWFLRKNACLTGFVTLYLHGFRGERAVWLRLK